MIFDSVTTLLLEPAQDMDERAVVVAQLRRGDRDFRPGNLSIPALPMQLLDQLNHLVQRRRHRRVSTAQAPAARGDWDASTEGCLARRRGMRALTRWEEDRK